MEASVEGRDRVYWIDDGTTLSVGALQRAAERSFDPTEFSYQDFRDIIRGKQFSNGRIMDANVRAVMDCFRMPGDGAFGYDGRAFYCITEASIISAVGRIRDSVNLQYGLGIDLEWDPSSGEGIDLIQLSVRDEVYIIRLTGRKDIPGALRQLLTDPSIVKIGQGIHGNDSMRLWTTFHAVVFPIVDNCVIASQCGYRQTNLKAMIEALFGLAMTKRFDHRSKWSSELMTAGQFRYAVEDAFANLCIYHGLIAAFGISRCGDPNDIRQAWSFPAVCNPNRVLDNRGPKFIKRVKRDIEFHHVIEDYGRVRKCALLCYDANYLDPVLRGDLVVPWRTEKWSWYAGLRGVTMDPDPNDPTTRNFIRVADREFAIYPQVWTMEAKRQDKLERRLCRLGDDIVYLAPVRDVKWPGIFEQMAYVHAGMPIPVRSSYVLYYTDMYLPDACFLLENCRYVGGRTGYSVHYKDGFVVIRFSVSGLILIIRDDKSREPMTTSLRFLGQEFTFDFAVLAEYDFAFIPPCPMLLSIDIAAVLATVDSGKTDVICSRSHVRYQDFDLDYRRLIHCSVRCGNIYAMHRWIDLNGMSIDSGRSARENAISLFAYDGRCWVRVAPDDDRVKEAIASDDYVENDTVRVLYSGHMSIPKGQARGASLKELD